MGRTRRREKSDVTYKNNYKKRERKRQLRRDTNLLFNKKNVTEEDLEDYVLFEEEDLFLNE
jgi:competence transcription factor ComK